MKRFVSSPSLRAVFLALAMVASALGVPIKVEPPPKGRVAVEVVRDEDPPDPS